jgi:hypothetical protein
MSLHGVFCALGFHGFSSIPHFCTASNYPYVDSIDFIDYCDDLISEIPVSSC